MKSHKIESLIFAFSIVSFLVFLVSIPVHFVVHNRFLITDLVSRFFYAYGGISPFAIIIIGVKRKTRGYKKPLSIEAMRNAKAESPNKIYKFCSLSVGGDESLDRKKLQTLSNNKIWMSDRSVLNDPFEGQYTYIPSDNKKAKHPLEIKFEEHLAKEGLAYIQSSFSYDYQNNLMWGHYANGCRGYCVEYKLESKDSIFPVQYLKKRPLLSSLRPSDEVVKNSHYIESALEKCTEREFFEYILYIQSIKGYEWSYEKEVRIVTMGEAGEDQKSGNVDINDYGLSVSRIIIGYKCAYKDELLNIARKLRVSASIMKPALNSNKYELIEEPIHSVEQYKYKEPAP